jgi:hypothetical protein
MAITNLSDFKIYNEQVHSGFIEKLTQFAGVFNQGSNGTINLVTDSMLGDYKKTAFFAEIGQSVISRQDVTTNAAVTPHKLSQNEKVDVKVFRKIEPIDVTYNSFAEIGGNAEEVSYLLGENLAQKITLEMLNTIIKALAAAAVSGLTYDATSTAVINVSHRNILKAMALWGDNSSKVKAYLMHSQTWFDLLDQGIVDGFEQIGTGVINSYSVPAFGRPVIVTDSPSLVDTTPNPDVYKMLLLTDNAATVSKIGSPLMASQQILGQEQLAYRMQGEYRYVMALKGFAYDTANGTNPTDTAIGTAANWDKCVTSDLDTAAGLLKVNPKP